jgi:hypothetical protein
LNFNRWKIPYFGAKAGFELSPLFALKSTAAASAAFLSSKGAIVIARNRTTPYFIGPSRSTSVNLASSMVIYDNKEILRLVMTFVMKIRNLNARIVVSR